MGFGLYYTNKEREACCSKVKVIVLVAQLNMSFFTWKMCLTLFMSSSWYPMAYAVASPSALYAGAGRTRRSTVESKWARPIRLTASSARGTAEKKWEGKPLMELESERRLLM